MNTRTTLWALCALLVAGASLMGACSSDSNPAFSNDLPAGDDAGSDVSNRDDAGADADPAIDASDSDASDSDAGDSGSDDTDAATDAAADADAEDDAGDPDADIDGGDDPGDADVDASEPDDAGSDASDPEAGPELPDVTCVDQSSEGAYSFNRSANKQILTPGGVPYPARYTLTRLWDDTTGIVQGTAEVFTEDEELFLRIYQLSAGEAAEHRTMWMQAEPDGSLTLTELCAPGHEGTVTTGIFEMRKPDDEAPELWIEISSGAQMRYTFAQD